MLSVHDVLAIFHHRTSTRTKLTTALGAGAIVGSGMAVRNYFHKVVVDDDGHSCAELEQKKEPTSLQGLSQFLHKFQLLARITVPSIFSREVGYLLLLGSVLISRTMLSIKVSEINGSIVKTIVERDAAAFRHSILKLAAFSVPAATVNSLLKYLASKLALALRSRLVYHFHNLYLARMMYYRLAHLDGRIKNPEHALTETIDKWSQSFARLYTNLTKPVLDIVLFSWKLAQKVGYAGPVSALLYYILSAAIMRYISPKFAALTARYERLEAKFRYSHSRLISHAEEVAFYGGEEREKQTINAAFEAVANQAGVLANSKLVMDVYNSLLVKYGAVILGYSVLAFPVFRSHVSSTLQTSASSITRDFVQNSSLLINLSMAIARIVTSFQEGQRLAGYTVLVGEIHDVLQELQGTGFRRRMSMFVKKGMVPGSGTVSEADHIIFDRVPVVTPKGQVLVNDLSFTVLPGMNLIIIGPNGSGKSSVFRILSGLWPLCGGSIDKPAPNKVFYIPQVAYMPVGTLRDQMIYPDTLDDMKAKGYTDDDLWGFLSDVRLEHLLEREGSWDKENDWKEVLSGGEQQRLAIARLFYHRPLFAILDECTSAVQVEVEAHIYEHCSSLNMTCITISHRPSLWKFHDYMLRLNPDGDGRCEFRPTADIVKTLSTPVASLRRSTSQDDIYLLT